MIAVELTIEAKKQLERLPKIVKPRIDLLLDGLEKWPSVSGVKSLKGKLKGWSRVRAGHYRVRFHVRGDVVIVDKIGHRSEFDDD